MKCFLAQAPSEQDPISGRRQQSGALQVGEREFQHTIDPLLCKRQGPAWAGPNTH